MSRFDVLVQGIAEWHMIQWLEEEFYSALNLACLDKGNKSEVGKGRRALIRFCLRQMILLNERYPDHYRSPKYHVGRARERHITRARRGESICCWGHPLLWYRYFGFDLLREIAINMPTCHYASKMREAYRRVIWARQYYA